MGIPKTDEQKALIEENVLPPEAGGDFESVTDAEIEQWREKSNSCNFVLMNWNMKLKTIDE